MFEPRFLAGRGKECDRLGMDLMAHLDLLAFIQLNAWKIVGLTGSAIFGIRFVLQWIASERARKSIIPVGFWECSLVGSLLALSYFAIYRRDSVGVIMTLLPVPIYSRNLYLKWKEIFAARNVTTQSNETELIAD
jgi:lipid-A-disaccharide synthase-like uncharacterized protein